jgi:hypothetical protein
MSKLIFSRLFFSVFVFCGCVHHLQTPDEPRAIVTNDDTGLRSRCKLLGVFEGVGETEEQARAFLSIHVRELGGTHVVVKSDRAINQKKSFNETWRNDTLFSPLYKDMVASGKGYRCH